MKNLPIQSAPVQRGRLTRAVESISAVGVSPSVCVGVGPAQICIGPFLNEGVSQSGCMNPLVCVGPFEGD